ncbi:8-amino-7-oxononanoate synthase, aonS [Afipia carboxidovorans OM5]|uniref:8-amino-7-oxononanoate synthase BioF n=1 Tax=Afipia carboxidovorans (strain ATCC 49405 / DSM 1227 / KCTC 32145 / OM5) TaxID=504832 RepID=B6JGF5_AFIC5|nr:8-amino-7-oxononanoate synthase [Afipia carboxidovorans]ACI93837.1 8-amino-7-oxononanoate synthase, aonS [Afipia carboxidovorans OM5]AEI02484.1 8-amino-7-oxononanoate synthase BioF [Afipia carboxidovorans OM4]AEI06060.1 8-amino-7-oxononanoate synthase BioF [Afipia carboxidovorans OM5]
MPSVDERYRSALDALTRDARLRSLHPRQGIDFVSNDYLALAESPRLRQAVIAAIDAGTPIGAGGSRLLRGNCAEHEQLEAQAAAFFKAENALYFGAGYSANFAALSTLPQRGDLLIMDELSHASMREGAKASRAEIVESRHNDAGAVEDAIRTWRANGGKGRPWIAVESIYSMDGDIAPLDELMQIADRHDGFLYIDEAHATGVFGPDGRGLSAPFEGRANVVAVHTCGKALGASGALVLTTKLLRDFLVNRSRPFIFATAPSPLMAVAVGEALNILREEPERRERLHDLIALAGRIIGAQGWTPSGTQIIPYLVGHNDRTMALASALQHRGFDIRGIRPPTVPAGTARLRISLTLNASADDLQSMLAALAEEAHTLPA